MCTCVVSKVCVFLDLRPALSREQISASMSTSVKDSPDATLRKAPSVAPAPAIAAAYALYKGSWGGGFIHKVLCFCIHNL